MSDTPAPDAKPAPGHTRRYTAFISYRHADNTQEGRRWAEWLHRALERYVVPPDLFRPTRPFVAETPSPQT
ncbi:MAG TPA: hypothetical protein VK968_13515 [Roseimicrobium sp.]|nr:hypothetical protein [Roseimicrobium sp.]